MKKERKNPVMDYLRLKFPKGSRQELRKALRIMTKRVKKGNNNRIQSKPLNQQTLTK